MAPPAALVIALLPQAFGMTRETSGRIRPRRPLSHRLRRNFRCVYAGDPRWASWFFRKHRVNRFPAEFDGSYLAFETRLRQQAGHWKEPGTYVGGRILHTEFACESFAVDPIRELVRCADRSRVPVYLWWSPSPRDALSGTHVGRPFRLWSARCAWPFPACGLSNQKSPCGIPRRSGRQRICRPKELARFPSSSPSASPRVIQAEKLAADPARCFGSEDVHHRSRPIGVLGWIAIGLNQEQPLPSGIPANGNAYLNCWRRYCFTLAL